MGACELSRKVNLKLRTTVAYESDLVNYLMLD
jgi:hypothetical protein